MQSCRGKRQLWIWSLILMYFAGLASWRWRVVAKGFGVKTNKRTLSFHAFAEDLVVFEVVSKGERQRQTGIESWAKESSEGRRASYRSAKPLS